MHPSDPRVLSLDGIHRSRRQLALRYGIGDLSFHTTFWYDDVDLPALEARHGVEVMQRIYLHVALFDLNKLVSLRPDAIDLGPWRRFVTPALAALWRTVTHRIFAQWRYENDLPDYETPPLPVADEPDGIGPLRIGPPADGRPDVLAFCGGGKDSLVMNGLLQRAGVDYGSFAYAHSVYGRAAPQHALIGGLLDRCTPKTRHRMWSYDDTLDAPIIELCPELGTKTLCAGETPSALFAAVPVMLTHGYRRLALGHEASANVGNLVWDRTGEMVNHQWGKSLEAERLLNGYLQAAVVADARYFSLLQPIHDAVIFNLLRRDAAALDATHSCNVAKPWCKRCPKCAYVWMNYMAWLDPAAVEAIFGENLFDLPENRVAFRQMVGLGAHTPFECIGQVEEARVAMRLCAAKSVVGAATAECLPKLPPLDLDAFAARFMGVDAAGCDMPPGLAEGVIPQMKAAAAEGLAYARRWLEAG